MSICTIRSLDHLVLTVTSLPRTIAFYTSLGMTHTPFQPPSAPGTTRHSLIFGTQKINLHEAGKEFEPKAGTVQVGSGDLCFVVEDELDEVKRRLEESGVEVLQGKVVPTTGARGQMRSVYVRDPDDNLIE
ncbi:hypothetical protein IAT38_003918 [Cryptococcus sp. DSM 104549]